jgi:hypothetical protein
MSSKDSQYLLQHSLIRSYTFLSDYIDQKLEKCSKVCLPQFCMDSPYVSDNHSLSQGCPK